MNAVTIIEDFGFDVVEARAADEAIAILGSRADVYLVFSDVHMPGSMDGLKLMHHIRNRWPPIKLITKSGKARLSADELPDGGQFLSKPYSVAALGNALRKMTDV